MAYFGPEVKESGLVYPTFKDCEEYLISNAKDIFGKNIYLDADSMDMQQISVFAKCMHATFKCAEYAYNNYNPQTAIGTGLARCVMLNGMKVKPSGYSTCYVELGGEPYTTIKNGVVSDKSGNKWKLPDNVNLGKNGIVFVTVTAQEKGSIIAVVGDICNIETPQHGWKYVKNNVSANIGQKTETLREIRKRQQETVALPSQGLREGTQSALLQINGVTDAKVEENDENIKVIKKGFELPPNSITCIVKGGSEQEILNTIFYKKNQGVYTHGDIEGIVYDKYQNINRIRFFRQTVVEIKALIVLTPKKGYSSDITDEIKSNLVNYVDSLNISSDVSQGIFYTITNQSNPDLKNPTFSINSIQIARLENELDTKDININLNEEANLLIENITVQVVNNGNG